MPDCTTLLALPAGAYLASGALYIWRIVRRDKRAAQAALVLGLVGVAAHGVLLLLTAIADSQAICATVSCAASLVSFLTAVGFLAGQRLFRLEAVGAVAMPVCFAGALAAAVLPSGGREIPEMLRSVWFFVHVPPALLAYVSFGFSFAAATLYLSEAKLLRSKRIQAVIGVLPSLDELEGAMYRTATFGFLLLTIGMATGSVWAEAEWGAWWSWTPKQNATLVTWLVFATYLHLRLVRGSRSRAGAWIVVLGFVSAIATFLATGLITHDPHRFL